MGSHDVVLLSSPLTFDPSVIEIFVSLISGATLLSISSNIRASPDLFLNIVFPVDKSMLSPSIVQITPSVFKRWTLDEVKSRILNNENRVKVIALGTVHLFVVIYCSIIILYSLTFFWYKYKICVLKRKIEFESRI